MQHPYVQARGTLTGPALSRLPPRPGQFHAIAFHSKRFIGQRGERAEGRSGGYGQHRLSLPHSRLGHSNGPQTEDKAGDMGSVSNSNSRDAGSSEAAETSSSSTLLSVFCPLLRAFSGSDAAAPRPRWLEVTTSGLASIARLPFGSKVGQAARARSSEPPQPLQLYEFEACPFCRRVREAITDLDLAAVEVLPCPKDSLRHRAAVQHLGGKLQFPFLHDPNTGQSLYESDVIVRYLYDTYGGAAAPQKWLLESTLLTGWMPTLLRIGRGMVRYPGAAALPPAQPLQLYSYENNQFARLVREALCELELPYRLVSAGKGSRHHAQLKAVAGQTTVPFLVDPNTGVAMAESADIVRYLFRTYGGLPQAAG